VKDCPCRERHEPRRVVLTGGPGAGKTAVLELIRQSFCVHVKVLRSTIASGVTLAEGTEAYISLADYKGRWVVLFFYPRDFTFICPTELKEFAKRTKGSSYAIDRRGTK